MTKVPKNGSHTHFVKILTWYSVSDNTIGSSAGCAECLSHSLKYFFGEDEIKYILYGTMTHSGGGGTRYLLYRELNCLEITASDDIFLVGFCTLCFMRGNINTELGGIFVQRRQLN